MAEIHFECVQIYMPYVSGTCTLPIDKFWPEGYHTPLTCQEPSNGTWCYSFTTSRIGVPDLVGFRPVDKVNGGTINRAIPDCIKFKSINETTPKLQDESGLASRGGFTCSFVDFDGDPGPINKTDKGSYFSKLIAR
ncbi:MAG: hypothetical protein GY881_13870, partial [Gammaproteobacteria bacterium]|nr:hypothetical protein [Gammaproteobacteria bacterium]